MATTPLTALILEDEPLIALDLEDMLELAGFEATRTSDSCADALRWLEAETPSLALLDICLKDGLCTEVAALLKAKNIPFVICSGAHPQDFSEFLSAENWLSKPMSHAALLTALRDALPDVYFVAA